VLGSGGGSAHVVAPSIVTPFQGINARAARDGIAVTFDDGGDRARAASVAKAAGTAVVFVAKWSTESKDAGNISLPDADNQLIEAVSAANLNTVVVLNTGGPVTVRGVFAAWYPGQEYGHAIASLLSSVTQTRRRSCRSHSRLGWTRSRRVISRGFLAGSTPSGRPSGTGGTTSGS
jgi:beta-glucosidase